MDQLASSLLPASLRHPAALRRLDLAFSVAGIFVCYLYYGVLQNELYVEQADGTKFGHTSFVLLIQCLLNAAVALGSDVVGRWTSSSSSSSGAGGASAAAGGGGGGAANEDDDDDRENAKASRSAALSVVAPSSSFWKRMQDPTVALTAFVYVFAMFSSNEALKYVSYAYQALAKSCKPIPVMVASMIIGGKRYSRIKYACVLAMVAGITVFQFVGDSKKGGKGGHGGGGGGGGEEGSAMGLLFLAISLALDGANGPLQEKVKKIMTEPEQGMANNLWAVVYMTVVAAALGQLGPAVSWWWQC
jgi:uncharacterized membrane protein YgcG